ncbi:MAG TPA: DUF3570 domain-containing protein [Ideonella sp.]|uniref:DUF3570 domain-containing protein n=1 Tax=Ideonella sp. TaxID=1929293 RepID=UPI002B774B63|nr:DUF3570 domain-containing protein [Ideonella sp.]HSI51379.1 DUF3570 domain-containing protein [Ideonella sp.]
MAATEILRRIGAALGSLGAGLAALLGHGAARAVDLPADTAEAMVHIYDGGGVKAIGPAFLVRKNIADKVSLSGTYYVDMVSNASIDVVTTASAYKEVRNEFDLSMAYATRDSLITLSGSHSQEPDYVANSFSVDVSQEIFSGLSTISLGFTRGQDQVGMKDNPSFSDSARHWQYRVGGSLILSPRWVASANLEAIADDGYLGSPYRLARVFGSFIHENNPSTRASRAVKFRVIGDVGEAGARSAVHAEYRYFWDNWAIRANTLEAGYTRYLGDAFLVDGFGRYNHQTKALFYSDNAPTETTYFTRNRQLGTFNSMSLGAHLSWNAASVPGKYDVKLHGSWEIVRFDYQDFTDIRTGKPYAFTGHVVQLYMTATF